MKTLSAAITIVLGVQSWQVSLAGEHAHSAKIVTVGDGTLDGSFLKPYNNAWFYSAKLPDGRVVPQGIWSDHMQWMTIDGKQRMLRVQGTTFITGAANTIVNVFDPKSLAPIRSERHDIDGTLLRRSFEGAHVTSVTLANAKDTRTPDQANLSQPVYDFNGGMYGILLAALPLEKGLRGSLPAMAENAYEVEQEPVEAIGRETVDAGRSGKVTAWVVDCVKPKDYTMRFWLIKEPPYIIKLVMSDEAHDRVLTWEML